MINNKIYIRRIHRPESFKPTENMSEGFYRQDSQCEGYLHI